ncbi:DUF6498-containing protein [Mycolicibacterium psychrotolerans]|uniref:Uncharacterized protein n=1 Tax=Mycolicibacterium psychrotolerans TaxID=216929 RepID=A0A7I7M6L2_9MYCO|nr:DUF6498-containing protein [Mycolicibacterium psychrotolerans]BBX67512.1 hypothetical protein MPSYJ_09730 [Mycolicibacterium psychrotolerans]
MIRFVHLATLLAVIAVPVVGWFTQNWSGATTLVVYWFETAAGCGFIAARILVHQRWSPRRGHFRYAPPSENRRTTGASTFLTGFVVTSTAFTLVHGIFLAVIIVLLDRHAADSIAVIGWGDVRLGALCVLALLALDFVIDLLTLRGWPFSRLEQTAQRGLSRVIVVHLTLIFGMAGIAVTGASSSLFSVFVVLKTMAALSTVVPQWEPARPPRWLSRLLNRIPNAYPGQRFEEFWASGRADEQTRRERNEQPWR